MASEVYEQLNRAWLTTTKMIFGENIGELREFGEYLSGTAIGKTVTSSISGKPLWVASKEYSDNAGFFDHGTEQAELAKSIALTTPLDINSIKDIDSLIGALGERLTYSGNKVLGNSKGIEHSDAIVDGNNILNSSMIVGSKCVAYSYLMRYNEFTFGSASSGQSSHIIRCFNCNTMQRCFECSTSIGDSDCYFVYNSMNCTDCLFTFGVRAKRYFVGNVELPRDKYATLKAKLLSELVGELKAKKKLGFSIIDILNADGSVL